MPLVMVMLFQSDFSDWFVCLRAGDEGGGGSLHWDVVSPAKSGPTGPFLKSPGNLLGVASVFGDKCFLTEVDFC